MKALLRFVAERKLMRNCPEHRRNLHNLLDRELIMPLSGGKAQSASSANATSKSATTAAETSSESKSGIHLSSFSRQSAKRFESERNLKYRYDRQRNLYCIQIGNPSFFFQ